MKDRIKINKEAKEYLLAYLQEWIDRLNQYPFSYRKGIVRAIYNKIESIPSEETYMLIATNDLMSYDNIHGRVKILAHVPEEYKEPVRLGMEFTS